MKVMCYVSNSNRRYRIIAEAMAKGIRIHGDEVIVGKPGDRSNADVGVMYGWKLNAYLWPHRQFISADLGFWERETYYRMTANAWGAESYVHQGMPDDRLKMLGVNIQPWHSGDYVLLVGSSRKSAYLHGLRYMEWERKTATYLMGLGLRVIYRPKPTDVEKARIPGCGYDLGPMEDALAGARAVVTHHSNMAVQAIAAGVPVHSALGAAAAFSVPLDQLANPSFLPGREQFLADVAYLQWTPAELASGEYWKHVKDRGIIC